MSIFRKKEETKGCCCGGNCNSEAEKSETTSTEGAAVKSLGSGCKKCNALEANTVEALKQLGMDNTYFKNCNGKFRS